MEHDYLVDESKPKPDITDEENHKRTGYVNIYILSQVSSEYKRVICGIDGPAEMIKKLQN